MENNLSNSNIKNPLLKGFLSVENNNQLFIKYQVNKSVELKEEINKMFIQYHQKVRLISYFSKLIHFEAIKFDKKLRKLNEKQLLILDKPHDGGKSSLIDQIKNENANIEISNSQNLEDYIVDDKLFIAITKLTERQRFILFSAFIKGLRDTEIARSLNVSQQVITKTKNTALNKIRGEIYAG